MAMALCGVHKPHFTHQNAGCQQRRGDADHDGDDGVSQSQTLSVQTTVTLRDYDCVVCLEAGRKFALSIYWHL